MKKPDVSELKDKSTGFIREFKEFAVKGNVMDLAIGVVIGGAFGPIVKSLVDDVIMPPIGLLLGHVDFSNLFIDLSGNTYPSVAAAKAAGAATINYGLFLNTLINFVIVAFAVFLMVRQINKLRRPAKNEPPPPSMKKCPYCISDIAIAATRCPHCTSEVAAA